MLGLAKGEPQTREERSVILLLLQILLVFHDATSRSESIGTHASRAILQIILENFQVFLETPSNFQVRASKFVR